MAEINIIYIFICMLGIAKVHSRYGSGHALTLKGTSQVTLRSDSQNFIFYNFRELNLINKILYAFLVMVMYGSCIG